MKNMLRCLFLYLIFAIAVQAVPLVDADIILLNSGVGQEVMITVGGHIGGGFFGNFPKAVTVDDDDDSGDTGGSSGGGGGGGAVSSCDLIVVPSEINLDLQVDTNERVTVKVTNTGAATAEITPDAVTFENVLFNPDVLSLAPGQTKDLNVTFVASEEAGVFVGTIQIGCAVVSEALNVKTLLLLFDSNIVVLNEEYTVKQGGELNTLVTLIPMGEPSRLDVTLDFEIRDYSGKVYLTKSDTLLVTEYVNVERNFDTGMLPAGSYIIGLNLIYPGGVAPSSAHFIVAEREVSGIVGKIMFFIVILILLIVIALIVMFIVKRIRNRENEGEQQETPSPDQGQFFPQFPGTMQ
ncbi:MAG: hypothetical protein Q8P81_00225 [Nanoarchaeota archaeon]|nr:hypothetical protein [Nanoarchaeota archaeon]